MLNLNCRYTFAKCLESPKQGLNMAPVFLDWLANQCGDQNINGCNMTMIHLLAWD
jgi:hypothetical protein